VVLHPEKTKIVYCKDANRRGDFPNQSFDFLGFSFRARKTMWQGHRPAHGFMPAASPKALAAISRTIRRWTLHQRSDKSLQDLANMYNPYIGGWINYYGQQRNPVSSWRADGSRLSLGQPCFPQAFEELLPIGHSLVSDRRRSGHARPR
jgi:hypothetical protein